MTWTTELPNLVYISSPRGSGKSHLICQMLLNEELYFQKYDKVFIFSPSIYSPVNESKFLLLGIPPKRIFTKWDEKTLIKIDKEKMRHIDEQWCIIVDDFISRKDFKLSEKALEIMVNGRHKNLSLWVTSQKNNLGNTTLRCNADQFITFELRSQNEMESIYKDNCIGGLNKKQFYKVLSEATKEKYSFLNINYQDREIWYSFKKHEIPRSEF